MHSLFELDRYLKGGGGHLNTAGMQATGSGPA